MLDEPPILDVRVYGLPVAQARVKTRLFKHPSAPLGVTATHYEPDTSRDWKRTVQGQIIPLKPTAPVDGAVCVELAFYLPRPRSLPKRITAHTTRPDVDNLGKAIKDCMRGVIYRDDSQVVISTVSKHYDLAPGVHIRVRHLRSDGTREGAR